MPLSSDEIFRFCGLGRPIPPGHRITLLSHRPIDPPIYYIDSQYVRSLLDDLADLPDGTGESSVTLPDDPAVEGVTG